MRFPVVPSINCFSFHFGFSRKKEYFLLSLFFFSLSLIVLFGFERTRDTMTRVNWEGKKEQQTNKKRSKPCNLVFLHNSFLFFFSSNLSLAIDGAQKWFQPFARCWWKKFELVCLPSTRRIYNTQRWDTNTDNCSRPFGELRNGVHFYWADHYTQLTQKQRHRYNNENCAIVHIYPFLLWGHKLQVHFFFSTPPFSSLETAKHEIGMLEIGRERKKTKLEHELVYVNFLLVFWWSVSLKQMVAGIFFYTFFSFPILFYFAIVSPSVCAQVNGIAISLKLWNCDKLRLIALNKLDGCVCVVVACPSA